MSLWKWILGLGVISVVCASAAERVPRIIGGAEVQRGSYPFMAALVYDGPGGLNENHFCGGTLIDPEWVLSAAHCLVGPWGYPDLTPDDFRVIIGIHNLNTDTIYRSVQVEEFFVLPGFDGVTLDGDAVLIRLAERIENAAPIKLNTSAANERAGLRATTAGWGLRSEFDTGSPILLEVDMPLVHRVFADARFSTAEPLTEQMLAAGGESGRDTCSGDSGGPLFLNGPEGFLQIGITSFGTNWECGDPDALGIYTRVSALRKWIADTRAERFDLGLSAYVNIHTGLPQDPTRMGQVHYARIFEMAHLPAGERIVMESWGDGFRPRVAVLDDRGFTVSVSNPIGEESVEVAFTPAVGRTYRIILSGEQANTLGTADIGFGTPPDSASMYYDRALEPGRTIHDSIDEIDKIDDDIYAMIYLLDRLVPGETYHLTATSAPHAGGVPIWLYLLDAEGVILERRETDEASHHISFVTDASEVYYAWVENGNIFDFTGDFSISLAGPRRPSLPEHFDAVLGAWIPFATDWIYGDLLGFFVAKEREWPWVYRFGAGWTYVGPGDAQGRWVYVFGSGWAWMSAQGLGLR